MYPVHITMFAHRTNKRTQKYRKFSIITKYGLGIWWILKSRREHKIIMFPSMIDNVSKNMGMSKI